jgi:DNA-binding transcriptional ArsR family regulator
MFLRPTSNVMNDILGQLFGSSARVKILRLLLSNQEDCFTLDDIAAHTKVTKATARKELALLKKVALVKDRSCLREVTVGKGAKKKTNKKKSPGFIVNPAFEHLFALRNFILNIAPTDDRGIMKQLSGTGRLKLVIISGVFLQDNDSRIDIMIVGDALNEQKLKTAIRDLESNMGRELRFAAFSTDEFMYRIGIYDRLIRDVLDYPHQMVLDRLGSAWKDIHMRKKESSPDS